MIVLDTNVVSEMMKAAPSPTVLSWMNDQDRTKTMESSDFSITSEPGLQQQLDTHRRKVDVDHYDVTIRELIRMTAESELERAPLYQRKFRWNEKDESHLVESILLGLPIPSLFVATNA